MLMLNSTASVLKVMGLGLDGTSLVVQPGEAVEIPTGYCKPSRSTNGSRRPSIIENLAPGLVPADESIRKEWLGIPDDAPPPKPLPTKAQLVAGGVPPGVAQILEQKAAEENKPKAKPKAEPKAEPKAQESELDFKVGRGKK